MPFFPRESSSLFFIKGGVVEGKTKKPIFFLVLTITPEYVHAMLLQCTTGTRHMETTYFQISKMYRFNQNRTKARRHRSRLNQLRKLDILLITENDFWLTNFQTCLNWFNSNKYMIYQLTKINLFFPNNYLNYTIKTKKTEQVLITP